MTIHREGYKTIALVTLILGVLNLAVIFFFSASLPVICWILFGISFIFLLFIISFFRIPGRELTKDDLVIIAPADGKVVVIEETNDVEYFRNKRLQVSIFMSPANVHVNRNPVSGQVVYSQYHKGKYLVAWNPKSSTDNERHTVVIRAGAKEVLVKQIAGAVARRIVNYLKVGQEVVQSEEMGFIKFGSRVDLLLPLGINLKVKRDEMVKGGVTIIGVL